MNEHRSLKQIIITAALSSLLLCSCAEMFEDRVEMQNTHGTTLATLFNADKVIEKLDAPKQIFVTNGEFNNKIIVSWEMVEGAASYTLERAISDTKDEHGNWKAPDEGAYEPLEHSKFIEGTTYIDTIIDNSPSNLLDYTNQAYNSAFFYRVCADNAIKNYESSDFTYSSSGSLLTPPSNIKASCGASKTDITLTWKRAPGSIASYRIYRSTNSDGSGGSQVGTVYGNSEKTSIGISAENQGEFFYFTLVSIGASGNESVASSVAMGYTLKEGAPTQVEEVEIEQGRGQTKNNINIKWKAASGGTTVYYHVYRYSSSDSTLKQLTDSSGITTTDFSDTSSSLKPNVFYYYQVQAWVKKDDKPVMGQMSDSGDESKNPAEGYLLSPPKSVTVKKIASDAYNNKIIFTAAIGSEDCASNSAVTKAKKDWNTYSYVVYGSDTPTGFTDTPLTTISNPTKASESGYYEATVPSCKFYKMATQYSSVISAHTSVVAPAPNPAQNFAVTKNAAVAGYTNNDANANANGVHAIKLTWQAPQGGADGGYHIYRSTKPDSGFKKITENPVTDLFYVYKDPQAKAGNYYYYRVLSLNSLGQGDNNNPSNTDYGYGALTTYQYVREYIKTTLNSQKKLTLMHKSAATDKLGSDSCKGDISGTLTYDASMQGLGGRVIMHYTNYADYYIMNDSSLGVYFLLDGNTNTTANISSNGNMDGTVTVRGMYPGSVVYDKIEIKGGAAGGGTYGVTRTGIDSSAVQADWTWGEK